MQTKSTNKQQKNTAKVLILAVILLFALIFGVLADFNADNVNAEELGEVQSKAFEYVVSSENNHLALKGKYEDSTEYFLTNSALDIIEIMNLIEADRENLHGTKENVGIYFDDVDLGNKSVPFRFGRYSIKGKAVIKNISAKGGFSVSNGAYVSLGDVTLTSQGTSPLIEVQNARLDVNAGKLTAKREDLVLKEGADVKILGAELKSEHTSAILSQNTDLANKPKLIVSANAKVETLSSCSAIELKNVDATIRKSKITALGFDYALTNEGLGLIICENPTFISIQNAISTSDYFGVNSGGIFYSGEELKVNYSAPITAVDTCLAVDANEEVLQKIKVLNSSLELRLIFSNIFMSKQFSVKYFANCGDQSVVNALPVDENKYLSSQQVEIKSFNSSVREHFEFLGWSLTENSADNLDLFSEGDLVNIGAEDMNLYAVWRPITYVVTYENVGGVVNNNPVTYDYSATTMLTAPMKDYHKFVGWQISGEDEVFKTLSLPLSQLNLADVTLTPLFELTKYPIIYNGLTNSQIKELGLKEYYTINDPRLDIGGQNYCLFGNSFCGIYSNAERTNSLASAEVSFAPNSTCDFGFVVGELLNFYVDLRPFNNGAGKGTKEEPFILDSAEQFESLLVGKKVQSSEMCYVKLNKNIEIAITEKIEFVSLKNFVIEGNKNTIFVRNLIEYKTQSGEKIFSIFPRLENSQISNLNIKNAENVNKIEVYENSNAQSLSVALFAHNLNLCVLNNVSSAVNVQLKLNSLLSGLECKVAGITNLSVGSVLQGVRFSGSIETNATTTPATLYSCGLVCESQNSIILNSKFAGKMSYEVIGEEILDQWCAYFAGIGILIDENLVLNSSSQGEIKSECGEQNFCILSAVAINLGVQNVINNCLSITDLKIEKGEELSENQQLVSCVWGLDDNIEIINVVCLNRAETNPICVLNEVKENVGIVLLSNQDYSNLKHIELLESGMQNAQNVLNLWECNPEIASNLTLVGWKNFVNDEKATGIFLPKLTLTVKDAQSGKECNYVIASNFLKGELFPIKAGYLFDYYSFDAEGKNRIKDLRTISGDVVLYANYITYEEYAWRNFAWWIAGALIVIVLLLVFVIVCERKKEIIFVFNGKEIHKEKIKINASIPVVAGKENILWFKGEDCKKPFTKTKMPFVWKRLKLVSFKDEIRLPLEKLHENQVGEEIQAKEKIKSNKKQKSSIKQEIIEATEQKNVANKEENQSVATKKSCTTKKQTRSSNTKKSKNKAKQEIEDSGITIVKKEIKTLPKIEKFETPKKATENKEVVEEKSKRKTKTK